MRINEEAQKFINKHGREAVKKMGVIYYADAILNRCRKCRSVFNKHKQNDEQDLKKILDKKQYCNSCNNKLSKLWKLDK